ncbi:flavodoxin FldA [Mycoplasmoides pirum]|uniref:flavodoxin FldA n=1 Tax=Mycoplasmoides pirum TaxID=2122 RepID=UPI000485260B|nr:flavodoxin FldA [Mycoplasmoides pirum]
MKIAIIYGTNLGNTATIAKLIGKELNINKKDIFDVNDAKAEELNSYDAFIMGTSTWGIGDMADGWKEFEFKKLKLDNKVVAIFGLGDSQIYTFSFCNGMGELHRALQKSNKKIKIVGYVDTKNYTFSESKAIYKNKFVGLALDYDNFPEQVESQIKNWIKDIKKYFI